MDNNNNLTYINNRVNLIGQDEELSSKNIKNKKSKKRAVLGFLIFELIFFSLTTPLMIFYGPFNNVKRTITGISWNSFTHQNIARAFLSQNAIARILGDGYSISNVNTENIKMLDFMVKHTGKINVYDVKSDNFNGKMLIIEDPTRIEVGYSSQINKAGEVTSSIAKRNGAIAAINGGGFMDRKWSGTGGVPMGSIIHDGKYISGKLSDNNAKRDVIGFTKDGMLIVGKHSQNELKQYGINEAISFGPPLVVNGKPTISHGDGGWGISPRSAIGQREDGAVLLLVIDGRSLKSFGATLKEVQDIMIKYKAVNAANLDGGSSATMYYNGKVINTPSDALGERSVASVFMVMP
jgi:exopolysaccharide biosynthesis protein